MMSSGQTGAVHLRPGKDKPVRQRHPWVFSGAVARTERAEPGGLVDVLDDDGDWLARGYYNPRSQIVVRILSWDANEVLNGLWWRVRLEAAERFRAELAFEPGTTAYRLVHAESDGLPGLVVDRYGEWLVVQFLTLGVEARRGEILAAMSDVFSPQGIVERSDAAARKHEGLAMRTGLACGVPPPADLEVNEFGHGFLTDLMGGQKTGFYLDQRENRAAVAGYARDRRLLNAFSFTGAFGVYALAAGAEHVTNLDRSLPALERSEAILRRNGFDPDTQAAAVCGDVFRVLRDWRDEGRTFDLVILDPPKFARSQGELPGAMRGYKDINMLALQLLAPGGILATFSCSGLVGADLFQKIVFGASLDAGRDVQVLTRLGQGPDHPILLSFPEGEYLKGLLCRAV